MHSCFANTIGVEISYNDAVSRDIVQKDISTSAEVMFAANKSLLSVTGLTSNKHLVVRKQEELTKVLIFNRACLLSFQVKTFSKLC